MHRISEYCETALLLKMIMVKGFDTPVGLNMVKGEGKAKGELCEKNKSPWLVGPQKHKPITNVNLKSISTCYKMMFFK